MKINKISVIIATNNREKLLAQCIKSLAVQTYQDFEVVIVNDGGNKIKRDSLLFKILLRKILEKSLVIINNSKKSGSSKAWNEGIKSATGELLAFTDDDAVPNNNWLEEISIYFKLHPTVTAVNGKIEAISLKSVSERIRQTYYDFRDSMYSNGVFDQMNKKQYNLQTAEINLADWLSMANCAMQKKRLNKLLLFDEQMTLNAGHKLGHTFMNSALLVTYSPFIIVKHHHYRKLGYILSTKFRNGVYFCKIDSQFNISYKKRFVEVLKYIHFIKRNEKLSFMDKIVEFIFIVVLCVSYNFQKLINSITNLERSHVLW